MNVLEIFSICDACTHDGYPNCPAESWDIEYSSYSKRDVPIQCDMIDLKREYKERIKK